jgi:hypothetical protein
MSAPPSATRQNFIAEPAICRTAPGRLSIKASVRASPCERLTAAIQGSPADGKDRVWIGSVPPVIVSRSAPRPTSPRHISPSAGAPTMPSSGTPSVISARLTVNSLRPATNSLVPSSGSIRKKLPIVGSFAKWVRSSDRVATSGSSRASPSAMTRSAARSASVTGDPSAFPLRIMVRRSTARMAAPARATRSVSGSISAAAVSGPITGASRMDGPHAAFPGLRSVLAAQAPAVYQALKHA